MSPSIEPFNKAKYDALMDGHECSEVFLSALDETCRIDSEYYSKEYLREEQQLLKQPHFRIKTKYKVTDGEHGSVDYLENGVKYLTAENIKHGFVDLSKIRYVSEEVDKRNARASVNEGDILISIKGTIGSVAIADASLKPCNMNRDVAIIKPLEPNDKTNYLITLFLMGKYGALQSQRGGSGGVQQMITLGRLREFVIPVFSDAFCTLLKEAYNKSLALMKESQDTYNAAERFLEKELGIDMSEIKNGGISVKTFSECFEIQNRIDSEFYQPKYDKIIDAIKTYDSDAETIDTITEYLFTGECAEQYFRYEPKLLHYVRGTDINNGLVEIDLDYSVEKESHSKFVSSGDIITGRVGTIGNFGVISDELDGAVCSDNVLCFHLPEKYMPNVYALYFNSQAVKELTNRMSRGSVQQRLNQETLRDLIVPYISEETQKEIDKKVVASFEQKEKSEKLMNDAKSAVEIAIEKNEADAIKWLEDKMK